MKGRKKKEKGFSFWVLGFGFEEKFLSSPPSPSSPPRHLPLPPHPSLPHPPLMLSKDALFALSLFPYLGFLWFITRSQKMPRLALIGFYMTLVFVGVTIPAGIYAKLSYGKSLGNVDWLHGGAEFFLTLSNILVVLGFYQAIQLLRVNREKGSQNSFSSPTKSQ